MASESSVNGGRGLYAEEPELWRGSAADHQPFCPSSETGAPLADRNGRRTPSLSLCPTDSGLSRLGPGQLPDKHDRGRPDARDRGAGFGEDAGSTNGFSEESLLDMTFEACDATGEGEVLVSRVMRYLQDTARSPDQAKLATLYDMLDPERRDPAVTRDTFHTTMRMWIGQCCQTSTQEDLNPKLGPNLTTAPLNGNDRSPPETEAETENEVETPEGGDGCYCEWKDLLGTVVELKHARRRLSEQNGSLLRSITQSEDANLQLTLELAQLRAKLASSQRTAVRARSLEEELDEARQALEESKERSARAQATTCTLLKEGESLKAHIRRIEDANEKLSHEKACSEDQVRKLMRMNAEIRKELDGALVSLADKFSKETTFFDDLKISHLENLRVIEGMQLELTRLQENSRRELLRFDMVTGDPQCTRGGHDPVPPSPSLQSEIQETEKGENMEGANNPICGILPQRSQRDDFRQISHQIEPLAFVPLFHQDHADADTFTAGAADVLQRDLQLCQRQQASTKQQLANVERELEVQQALRAEVEGKLEEARKQAQEAKRMSVINWWKALKVDKDRTTAREQASRASRARDNAEEKTQRAEAAVQDLRDQVSHLQAELRTAPQRPGNPEGKEAAPPDADADASRLSEEQGDGVVATSLEEEASGRVAEGSDWGGGSGAKTAQLLPPSEGRLRQARERVEAATERVEWTLSGAADAMAHLGTVESKAAKKPEPAGPNRSADLGSVGATSPAPGSTERCRSPAGLESVSQPRQVPQGHLPNGGIISPGTGGGVRSAEDGDSPGTASLTGTPTPDQAPLSTPDSLPNIVSDDRTGSGSEPVRTQTTPLESGAHHVAPASGNPHPETRPDPILGNAPESHTPERTEGDSCQSEPVGRGRSQAELNESPAPIGSVKAEEEQTPPCAALRACDWPQETGVTTTTSPAPPSPSKGKTLCPRVRPPLVPTMPSLPEEEEDSPEDLDSASSSPVTQCTPVGNKVVTMAFPAPSIVFPSQDDPGDRDPKPLEQARSHSPRAWLSRKSSSSGGPITTFDSAGNVIDLVKDPLPDLQLSVEDKQKNLELLEEAKRVSDRFLSRRGRRSTSSLSESPTGSLSPNVTPYSSPAPSRSSSLTVPPQTAGLSSIGTPHSSPVLSRSNSLSVPCQNAPEEPGANYVSPTANQCPAACASGEQEDGGPQDQEGLRKLADWKPSEKRKVSSGTLTPRHAIPATAREGSAAQWESCEPRPGGEPGSEGPGRGPQRRAPEDEPPVAAAPRSASQQAPCTAEIRTMGAFPPLMRAVSWDTVGSFPARSESPGASPKDEESSESLFKSSGYKDFPVQPVKMQKLTKMREENKLIRNQSVVGSTLPDLSETAEQDRAPSPSASPEDEAKEKSDVMPNISDILLRKLKLHRALPGGVPPLTEKEIENAFVQLSLAFRNDNYTLETRLRQSERERNMTEENTEKELEEFKGFLKTSVTLWQTSEQRDSYQRLLDTVAVLHRLATRLSSRSEMVGAVRQEKRMNKATEVMMQYVENLKRTYEKDHAELTEFKKLANQNSSRCYGGSMDAGEDGVPRTSRSMSVTLGKALPRRRVSVAVVPKFNLLNIPGQSPLPPVLCEANGVRGISPADPAQQTLAESGKGPAEREGATPSPAKPPAGPPEVSPEVKAKIEEDAYNKGYQEGMKKSKELQELKEAEEKMEESRRELEEEKEKERERQEAKEKKHRSKYEKALEALERLRPKLFRHQRLLWTILTLFAVTFFLVGVFTYVGSRHSALGDVPAGKALSPGQKKFFGWNMKLQPKNPTPE